MALMLQAGKPFKDRLIVNAGPFQCPHCDFWRAFATRKGAIKGAAHHLMIAHRIRLALPESAERGK